MFPGHVIVSRHHQSPTMILGTAGRANGANTKLVAERARPKYRKNIDDQGCSNSASQARQRSKYMPRYSVAGTGLGMAGEAGAGTGLGMAGESSGAGTKLVAERARPKNRKNIDDQGCSNLAGQARRTSKSMPGYSGVWRDRPEGVDQAKDETI